MPGFLASIDGADRATVSPIGTTDPIGGMVTPNRVFQPLRGITVAHGVVRWDRPRPGVALPDAPGVFIAGDWVGDEGMISDASAASAMEAARAIVAMLEQRGASRSAA